MTLAIRMSQETIRQGMSGIPIEYALSWLYAVLCGT